MKNLIFLFLLLPVFMLAQDEVHLIEPIKESKQMNLLQANKLSADRECMNWGVKEIDIQEQINLYRGKGVRICICDTGRPDHDFIKVFGSANFTDDPTHDDNNGHSTHVGGIISEIVPDAELYFAKVLSDKGSGSMTGVRDGVDWCTNVVKAHFTNMSLGGRTESSVLKTALIRAHEANNKIVAAAGNDGYSENEMIGYPARDKLVLAIGSTSKGVRVSDFSSSGNFGDVMAPGEKILSTWKNNQFIELSGTSMAAPFVTGILALRRSQTNVQEDCKQRLKETAYDMLETGYDRKSFNGLITNKVFLDTIPNPTPPIIDLPQPANKLIFAGISILVIGVIIFLVARNAGKDE